LTRPVSPGERRGKEQLIDIEVFRWTIDHLLLGDTVLREAINDRFRSPVSSGVLLILRTLPMFEVTAEGRKQGLKMRVDVRP
jgi:hypothetical protein